MTSIVLHKNTSRNEFRYAFGSAFIVAVAMAFDWNLAFILPVLSLSFLASGDKAPSFTQGLFFVLTIAIASVFGLILSYSFLNIPSIHILISFLILFHIFYTNNPLISPLVKVWLMIAVLAIPNVALLSKGIATVMALSLSINGLLTIILIWFIFLLIPNRQEAVEANYQKPKPVKKPGKSERFNTALTNTLVIMPVFLIFYFFQLSSSLLILIFIAILSMQPAFAKDFKGGMALIIGNLIGGLASIVAFEILTVVPEFTYFVILIILSGLIFGKQVFSGRPAAPLYGMAYSTFLLIICSVTASGSGDAGSKVWTRVFQIMIAVIYVVSAFGLIEKFKKAQ